MLALLLSLQVFPSIGEPYTVFHHSHGLDRVSSLFIAISRPARPSDLPVRGWVRAPGDSLRVIVTYPRVPQGPGFMMLDSTWIWLERSPASGIPDTLVGKWIHHNRGSDTLWVRRPPAGQSLAFIGCYRPYMRPGGAHPNPRCSQRVITLRELGFPVIADALAIDTLPPAASLMALRNSYLYLSGVTAQGFSIADSPAVQISGSIDLRAIVAMDDWTPAGDDRGIIEKWAVGSEYIFRVKLTSGVLEAFWNDGTGNSTAVSTVAPAVNDGDPLAVRVTLDFSGVDPVATFFTKAFGDALGRLSDNTGWIQLGAAVTVVGGKKAIQDTASAIDFGHRGTNDDLMAGKYYEAVVMDGINGAVKVHWRAQDYRPPGNTITGRTGNTVTLTGNSWTFVPAWNPADFPILATARAFWFAGDGNGAYGPSGVNPWADLSGNNHHAQLGATAGPGHGDEPTFIAAGGGPLSYWLHDGNDFFQVADNDNLDFATTESFTVMWRGLISTTASGISRGLVVKEVAAGGPGWVLFKDNATDGYGGFQISDGTAFNTDRFTEFGDPAGVLVTRIGRRDADANEVETFEDGVRSGTPVTDTTTGTQANSQPIRIGAYSDVTTNSVENLTRTYVAAIWRSALSGAQLLALQSELASFRIYQPDTFGSAHRGHLRRAGALLLR